jgi:AcrR family transcriptional regulator
MKSQLKVMKPAAAKAPGESRGARDRIFDTARELFYRQGIRAVGVETIAAEAGTTKMSLYRHFPSKDDLTAACLRADQLEFHEWWDSVMAPHAGHPRKQLEALFQAFQSRACASEDESRGCPLANAAVELTDAKHPGRQVVIEHKADIRKRLRALCREMRARNPEQLGDALLLLMEGAYTARLVFGGSGPIQAVSKAARVLIEEQLS